MIMIERFNDENQYIKTALIKDFVYIETFAKPCSIRFLISTFEEEFFTEIKCKYSSQITEIEQRFIKAIFNGENVIFNEKVEYVIGKDGLVSVQSMVEGLNTEEVV